MNTRLLQQASSTELYFVEQRSGFESQSIRNFGLKSIIGRLMVGCNKSNLAHLGSMAEWFKHETVNFGNRGSNPLAPA